MNPNIAYAKILADSLPPGTYTQQQLIDVKDGNANMLFMLHPVHGGDPVFFCPAYEKEDVFGGRSISGTFAFFIQAKTAKEAFDALDERAKEVWEKDYKPQVIRQLLHT